MPSSRPSIPRRAPEPAEDPEDDMYAAVDNDPKITPPPLPPSHVRMLYIAEEKYSKIPITLPSSHVRYFICLLLKPRRGTIKGDR